MNGKKMLSRFEVWLVQLNPTQGREVNKTRPCVISWFPRALRGNPWRLAPTQGAWERENNLN
ncbi:type II toxin-antitoxin system PemK/MazF family toxin [Candidatus Venteria ishoeyi]|uniref:type II toxin-antitoxin system PemK/MazF family toxin n=1 Tax=Candidatus Venteria ishoeyi TaxID=1899563 RepID=UPI00255C6C46|nr:type II toxin-antitoxin system PemK/MazF family toxin [Candidatus Venteria ishoeyi]